MRRHILLILLSLIALQGALAEEPDTLAHRSKYEMRAVWLSTIWGLDWPRASTEAAQKRELDEQLDLLRENGINTIFLQVRGRGDVIYPSAIEPMHPRFYGKRYDPLAYAVEACHKRGMTVHAWITTLPLEDRSYRRRLRGVTPFYDKYKGHSKRHRGKDFMDPADSLTGIHLASLAREIAEKYPVEGIQLDYIRYPDFPARFPDDRDYRNAHTLLPKAEWRRSNITAIVRRIHETLTETDSTVLLSAATIGAYDQISGTPHIGWTARGDVYQDPVAWERAGAIDFIATMTYSRGSTFGPIIRDWRDKLSIPVVIGLGAFRTLREEGGWPAQQVIDQVAEVQSDSLLAGVALFRARQITERSHGLRDQMAAQCFRRPVLPHAPIVSADSTLLYPRDLTMTTEEDSAKLTWCGASTDRPCLYAIYLSTDSIPDTTTGRDLIAVTTEQSATIRLPESKDGERFVTLEISCYDLHTGLEAFIPGGAAIYQRPEPKEEEKKNTDTSD